MEPPDGCPPEVYDIMRQVVTDVVSYIAFYISRALSYRCTESRYSLTGVGFTARKETELSRHKSDARPVES